MLRVHWSGLAHQERKREEEERGQALAGQEENGELKKGTIGRSLCG